MSTPLNFDASRVDPTDTYTPIPAGDYTVVVTKAERKETRKKDGHLLELTLKVLEGQHKGRAIFERLNLWNANPTAVEIAQKRLSQYCHAIGRLQIADASELLNKPVLAAVSIKVDPKGEYAPSNEIRSIRAATGAVAAPTFASAPAPAAAPAAQFAAEAAPSSPQVGGTPPWA